MKKRYIYLFLGTIFCTLSCDNQDTSDIFADPWEHFAGYMQFYTGVNNGISITRSELVDHLRVEGKSFGVRGYMYDNTTSWDIFKNGVNAKPNLFGANGHNLKVSCSDGMWTYDSDATVDGINDKPWDATKKYTFYAYYPYNGKGITMSDAELIGVPYFDYRYGWLGTTAGDVIMVPGNENIIDLMTANATDVSGQSGKSIGFDFDHRLFAIEVLANNYNENYFKVIDHEDGTYGFEYQIDGSGNLYGQKDYAEYNEIKRDGKIGFYDGKYGYYFLPGSSTPIVDCVVENPDGTETTVYRRWSRKEISNLKITLKGLKHTSTRMFFNPAEGANAPNNQAPGDVTFQITNQKVGIPAFDDVLDEGTELERGGGVASSVSYWGSQGHDGYLMLIPQGSAPITCVLEWDERLKDTTGDNTQNQITTSVNFEAGRLYQVLINYIGESITIALIEAGKWTPHNVEYTFE